MARVAIIGAGSSGLSAIKECLAVGLEPVCYEKSDDVGGLWRYEEPVDGKDVHSSVYRNTIINTSREMMSFSDFPVPMHWPTFSHNKAILLYFKLFANHFGLWPYIKFNTEVVSVHPHSTSQDSNDQRHKGKWDVVVQDAQGNTVTETYDFVFIASGHHSKPKNVSFEGLDAFRGQVLHSHYYRDASVFKDKRCLVVGIGNSAVDIAVELSYYATQVIQSTRKSAWVTPRFLFGATAGDKVLSRLFYLLPMFFQNWIFRFVLFVMWGNVANFGFNPKHQPFEAHPTVSGELAARIGTGAIMMKNNVRRFVKGSNGDVVEFEDGTTAEVDVVILCTGYEIGFPFLDAKSIVGLETQGSNQVHLYKYVFPVNHDNIAFLGVVQPWGSIIPLSEIQARWACQVFSGAVPLASSSDRLKDVNAKKRAMSQRYVKSDRHTVQVDGGPYMDEIASQFGAQPPMWRLFFTDNRLWRDLMTGCWNSHQYRLVGPSPWTGARYAILKTNMATSLLQWKGLDGEVDALLASADLVRAKQGKSPIPLKKAPKTMEDKMALLTRSTASSNGFKEE